MDLYLTPVDVANVVGMTVQGLHKFCKDNGIETQIKGQRQHKIYPEIFDKILKLKGGVIKKKCFFTHHNIKGGIGKTFLAHALSTRASCYALKTLVIDLDKQANSTNSLGIYDEDNLETMYDLFLKRQALEKFDWRDSLLEVNPYLHVLPANIGISEFDLSLTNSGADIGKLFSRLLPGAKDEYDAIFIDLPGDFNRVTFAAHAFTGCALVPVNMEGFSVKGLKLVKKHIDFVKAEFEAKGDFKVVINKFDQRSKLSFELLPDLHTVFGKQHLCREVIPKSDGVVKALTSGGSIWGLPRSKTPALDGVEKLLFELFDIDTWKDQLNKRGKKKALEEVAHGY
ncbi:MAG: ParA family protein [Sphingobacteriales bacterium]|nr:MAG: ParA family protein [Sphingobacteriales bacterium]